ncbi:MAG: protein phosphatase 2C domain-containing protein [bacterium]|nr:protein phosphatase 2C domain-containing protein [bacterium]
MDQSGWYLVAVADGAGSARFSRRGAQLACAVSIAKMQETVAKTFDEQFEALASKLDDLDSPETSQKLIQNKVYEVVGGAAHAAFLAIQQEARQATEATTKDFATTLLLAAVKHIDRSGLCAHTG